MNLIALRGFKNNSPEIIKFAKGHEPLVDGERVDGRHEGGVHAGARFSIGGDTPLAELPDAYRRVVQALAGAKCVGDASDEKLCKKVDAEVAADKVKQEEASKLVLSGGPADMARQALAALIEAGWAPPTAKQAKRAEAGA